MKQRIISGVIMGAVVSLVLVLGLALPQGNIILTVFVSLVAALGVFELISNAVKIEDITLRILSAIYTVAMVFIFTDMTECIYKLNLTSYNILSINTLILAIILSVVYFLATAIVILLKQSQLDLIQIFAICGMPLFYAFAFSTIASVIIVSSGIYYLLLVLNFACVCDIGAYFVGVSIGKTKLCPEISPKKTVEGALGGIVCSIILSLIITLCFGYFNKIIPVLLLTTPLCVVGIAGDLFASVIKRKTGIKDYGDLIPGHGGILDRVDSVLFISPLVYCLMLIGAI